MKMTPAIIAIAATITGWGVIHVGWQPPRIPPPGVPEPADVCEPRPADWEVDGSVTGYEVRVRHPDGEYVESVGNVTDARVPYPRYAEDTTLKFDVRAKGIGGVSDWSCVLEWVSRMLVPEAQAFTIFQAPAPGTAAAEPPAAVVDTLYYYESFDTPNGYDNDWTENSAVAFDPDATNIVLYGSESLRLTNASSYTWLTLDASLSNEFWTTVCYLNISSTYNPSIGVTPDTGALYNWNAIGGYAGSLTQFGANTDGGSADYVTISTGELYYVLSHYFTTNGTAAVESWINTSPGWGATADSSSVGTNTDGYAGVFLKSDASQEWYADEFRVGNTRDSVLGYTFREDFDDVFHGDGYQWTWNESDDTNNAVYPTNTTCVTGTNSLYVHGSIIEGTNHYIYSDLGASLGLTDYVYRVYFNIADGRTSDHNGYIMSINSLGVSPDNYDVYAYLSYVSGSWYIRAFAGSSSAYSSSVNTNTWHYWEFHYPSGETRLDGSEDTNLADESSVAQARYVFVGDDSDANDGLDYYVDAIAIKDTTGLTGDDRWIGSVAYDYTKDPYCVGAWAMNGTTTETDLSTNGYTLTNSGTSSTNDVPTNWLGLSRDVEETEGDYLYRAYSADERWIIGTNNPISTVAWVKPESVAAFSTSHYGIIGQVGQTSGQYSWSLRIGSWDANTNDWQVQYRYYTDGVNGTTVRASEDYLPVGEWHHIASVYDGTNLVLYEDAIPVVTNALAGTKISTARLEVARAAYAELDGMLDDVAVFSRALTAAEIKEIYRHGITGLRGAND